MISLNRGEATGTIPRIWEWNGTVLSFNAQTFVQVM
jgi:hypothetical protein